MTLRNFRDVLRNGETLLVDGAIGTELYKRGLFINNCFENACLASPDLVEQVHKDYLQAGAQILTTNSWGANRLKLAGHNLQDKVKEINTKAVELAKKVAGDQAWVLGSVGPLGVRIEPFGPLSFQEVREIFKEQISPLVQAGIDLLSLETFADLSELQQAILAVREVAPDLPLIVNAVIGDDLQSPYGASLESIFQKFEEWDVDIVGLNCSVGPAVVMSAVDVIRPTTKKPISVRPNAGLPRLVDGRQIYMSTPEYFGHFAQEFFKAGVQLVGGCCGTSPEHTKAMANSLRFARASSQKMMSFEVVANPEQPVAEQARAPFAEKSLWSRRLAEKLPVYSIELLPPSGIDTSAIIAKAKAIRDVQIHAINIPDGPRASARMSAMITAIMLEREAKIETVLHYTCRDRNLLGMQSDMLGIHAVGLRNVLLVTGDPPKLGNYPNATGVFDVDAIGLTNMVHRLNGGIDLGGRPIGQPASLSIGVGVNPVHRDFDYEMRRFFWKVEAGAEWAITQPVFDIKALWRFLEYIDKKNIKIPIVAGIWPLTSYRNAIFMNNEVPGVTIPPEVIKRIGDCKTADEAKLEGVEIAREMVEKLSSSVAGIQISAPFGRIDLALKVLGR